jgi:microcystin-dependent protein
MSEPFIGEIRMAGFNFAPAGWAMCQGQLLSISQNSALFSLLGTSFGGNGVSNFQLPDLQGRSPVGTGQGIGLSPVNIGQSSGTENATLTINNLPAHTHTAAVTGGVSVSGAVAVPATTTASTTDESAVPGTNKVLGPVSAAGRNGLLYSTDPANTTLAPFNVSMTGPSPAITNSITGNGLPFSLRNPYLGITFIIALQGIFPSRG